MATVLAGLWVVGVTVVIEAAGWGVMQVLLVTGLPTPGWIWLIAITVNAVLVGVPSLMLALIPRAPAIRAAGRVWLLSTAALWVLGLIRAVPDAQHELYLALLTAAAVVLAVLLPVGRPGAGIDRHGGAPLGAVAAGLASLLPWLWLGALGGLLETVLAVAAAAAVGWLAAAVLSPEFWGMYRTILGGLIGGVALLLMGAGVGASGEHLAEMLVLPPLGFAAAALRGQVRWLVALAALGPLAFVDNEEVTLLLLGRDIPLWTLIAAGSSLAVALLFSVGYAFVRASRQVAFVTALAMLAAAVGVYIGLGQPGLYGEKLFVIMRDRANLSGASSTSSVYQLLTSTANRSQSSLRHDLDRLHLSYTPYYLVNGLEVDGGPAVREWLSRRDDVDRVLLSQQLRPVPFAPSTSHGSSPMPESPPWNVTALGADRVWSQLHITGSGIVVGTSDSGVDGAVPALAAGFRGGDDSWYDPWRHTRTPNDRAGHGTHTLATAVGRTNTGVAPGAQWVGCVNLDRNLGNPAHYLDCLQFMLAPFPYGGDPFTDGRPERAPQVLTNSWGCPAIEGCDESALRQATAALAAAGIFVVAAAGNEGPFCRSVADPPAPYPDVLTVGAVDRDSKVTEFSSRGPTDSGAVKPDVVAPGAGVLSAMPGGGYARLDGTSMATPHVAGVVALMWSANPALIGDLARTREILRTTARPASGDDDCDGNAANITGAGVVDAFAAVQAARG